jgi:DnaJ-class molecular chaperone
MVHRDPYDVLGLSPSASFAEVRAQYFRLARKHHPDKLGHVSDAERKEHEAIFKEITSAYDAIESGRSVSGGFDEGKDWRSVWSRVEGLFQKPEVWDCMKRVLQGTLEDMANQKRHERLVHTMHLSITLEELHQNKSKKLQLLLNGINTPVYVRVPCSEYPCAKVLKEIQGETHTINIHMALKEHTVYRFDDLLGTWDISTVVSISWSEYLQGKAITLPSLGPNDTPRDVTIPPMPRMDVPVVLAGAGVAGKGDLYVHLQWRLPTPECWELLGEDDKNNFIRVSNALCA